MKRILACAAALVLLALTLCPAYAVLPVFYHAPAGKILLLTRGRPLQSDLCTGRLCHIQISASDGRWYVDRGEKT